MSEPAATAGPGVIVIAESPVHTLLSASGVEWQVQERQPSVAAMWEALSAGRLSPHSRILVFSDSLMASSGSDEGELTQTARAIVAMANAGALVFIASSRPTAMTTMRQQIEAAARAQGIDPAGLHYQVLVLDRGGRAVLEAMREACTPLVAFPPQFPADVDAIFMAPAQAAPMTPSAPLPLSVPSLPPVGSAGGEVPPVTVVDELPPSASRELLDRPKRPGQVTITVTSSKGGSGKSTASILLAAAIARGSAEAGQALSVCVVDLDTRDGQVASLIGTFMPTALNIRVQPVWDEERIRRNLVHAAGLGIDCLLAPIRPRTADTVGPDFYRVMIRSLQRMYDVIVMDTSVQYLEPLIAKVALVEADEVLFVTSLASTAVQGMARALREITAPIDESGLGIPREKLGIIVNQSVANVGMERDQVLAAGLGVPVVGVIPLATKDVLTATNLNRMHELLDHPFVGPAYSDLARACLPGRALAPWTGIETPAPEDPLVQESAAPTPDAGRRRGLFHR